MPTLDQWIEELQAGVRQDRISAGITSLNQRIAGYTNPHDPLNLVKRLYLSHRTLNIVTLERRIVRASDGWLFQENDGPTRAMSDVDASDFFRRMLALDNIAVDDETAHSVERIARGWFRASAEDNHDGS